MGSLNLQTAGIAGIIQNNTFDGCCEIPRETEIIRISSTEDELSETAVENDDSDDPFSRMSPETLRRISTEKLTMRKYAQAHKAYKKKK